MQHDYVTVGARMNFEEIKRYWEARAAEDASAQSTTQDYFLREIEFRTLAAQIDKIKPKAVFDIGCGDARTTARLAGTFPAIGFSGMDYSASMIGNARTVISDKPVSNLTVLVGDVLEKLDLVGADLAYTSCCLINLPDWSSQSCALTNIHRALAPSGHYLMIENFLEGHENFNKVRELYGLPPIKIRDHNLFFERPRLDGHIADKFRIVEEHNISSTYYLVSRVIYSKICADRGVGPDYFDEHHRYAAGLPFAGEFGPVRLLVLRKV